MLGDDRETIFRHGHREFVGATDDQFWAAIGQLQFDFLRAQGLRPEHVLFDVACGSLRGGVHFIPYLDAGNYVGFDKFIELIILGIGAELGLEMYRAKQPRFCVGEEFDFGGAGMAPDYGIAQSLFTHLTADDIGACLRGLAAVSKPGFRFYATFFESKFGWRRNPAESHSHAGMYFTRREMEGLGTRNGFEPRYIGDWNHPRDQRMIEYIRRG